MDLTPLFKRPFIWLRRFRYRCGYGVHSPFAFSLITDVVYEKLPYYAYHSLAIERRQQAQANGWDAGSDRVNRLLFRLVNNVQPALIVEAGCRSASALYLQAAKPSADYLFAADLSDLFLECDASIGFLYLNNPHRPLLMEEIFEVCASRTHKESICVIYGIGHSSAMKQLWKRLQDDERVGITFDLYDVGLLFFDREKIKQHYIVNF